MTTIFSLNSDVLEESDYVLFLIKSLRKNSEKLIACTSNRIEGALLQKISQYADAIYQYDNYIDINRWKDVLIHKISREELQCNQELLLINDSMFGPIFPMEELLARLNMIQADFLGLTAHGKMKLLHGKKEVLWPRFIQTYFLLIRQPMLSSSDLIEYLSNLPVFPDYVTASEGFEYVFTETFEKKGYKWDVLIDTSDKEDKEGKYFESFILFDLYELVTKKGFPFIPKYIFEIDFPEMQVYNSGNDMSRTLAYLEAESKFDTQLIYKNIIPRFNLHDIINRLNLYYIVDESSETTGYQGKTAVFSYLFYSDLFEYSISKLNNTPDSMDVFIATDTHEKKHTIQKLIKGTNLEKHCKLILHGGKGRDLSALLVTFHDYILQYDLICFIHDKKSSQMAYATVGQVFNINSWENTLNSKEYILGVLELFEQHPLLGFLCPPMLIHNTYFHTGIDAWTICQKKILSLADKIGIYAKLDFNKNPVALGSVFWCRTKALKRLFEFGFQYSDFPDEPMPVDGTISHAIERIFPYVAQFEGYYSGYIMTKNAAADSLSYYKEALNLIMKELNRIKSIKTDTLQSTIKSINGKKHQNCIINYVRKTANRLRNILFFIKSKQ